jgi:hypothetical protein
MTTHHDDTSAARASFGSAQLWTGRALTGLAVAFLALDGVMKLVQPKEVVAATTQLGWPADPAVLTSLGVVLLAATALYAIPRTAVLGAILLTGYFGGAVATHVRIGSPLFSHILFGVYLGVFVWGGLWLRSTRLRALLS